MMMTHPEMSYVLLRFRFDVHGFTEDCPQDEKGILEAAQLRQYSM